MVSNLEYYKVFYYVAKYGSLTQAASELSVSQPAVSQSIKQLEDMVGVKLFTRIAKGVLLTKEGETLFSYVENALDTIEAGERKLAEMLDLEYGELRIGASDMTLRFYLLPFLEKFHQKFPHIKVSVTNAPTPETLQLLKEKKIDFGVVSTPFKQSKEMDCYVAKEIEDCFVAGSRFSEYHGKELKLSQLKSLPIISLEKGTSSRSYMDDFLEQNGVELCPEFELATSDMIVQFAARNLGIGNVMQEFAEEYIKDGRLCKLRFDKEIPKRKICVVTENTTAICKAGQKMLAMLKEI